MILAALCIRASHCQNASSAPMKHNCQLRIDEAQLLLLLYTLPSAENLRSRMLRFRVASFEHPHTPHFRTLRRGVWIQAQRVHDMKRHRNRRGPVGLTEVPN